MKNILIIVSLLGFVALMGCSSSDNSCDVNAFVSTCQSADMMETCTINGEVVKLKCAVGFHCVDKTTVDGSTSAVCEK